MKDFLVIYVKSVKIEIQVPSKKNANNIHHISDFSN